jgi:hypothetical protein
VQAPSALNKFMSFTDSAARHLCQVQELELTMLLSPQFTGSVALDQASVDHQAGIHAVLITSLGEIDFDCPHVDARADEQPLYYDEEPLSIWVLPEGSKECLELGGLHDLAGDRLDPWPVLEQEIYLSDMLKRDEASLNILDLYLLTLHEAVQRVTGATSEPDALRICCTRDLLALDARLPDGRPLRPRLADLRGIPEPLASRLEADDFVLPVFDRSAGGAHLSSREAFQRRHAVDAQMRALLKVVRAPDEAFIDRRLCA